MINLQIVPINNKIDTINDPEVIGKKRQKEEDKTIQRINRFMVKTSQKINFICRCQKYPYNPTTEFFEGVKNKLDPEGYICTFTSNKIFTWFKITLPENRVNIPLENTHEKRKLVLVKTENLTKPVEV